MYGCESWTFSVETRRNIAAAEIWFYRRMLRVSYVDRITNVEVLKRVNMERQLLRAIEQRQLRFLDHNIRTGALEDLSLSGKFEGKRSRGRQQTKFQDNFELGPATRVWNLARNRGQWQTMVRLTPNR